MKNNKHSVGFALFFICTPLFFLEKFIDFFAKFHLSVNFTVALVIVFSLVCSFLLFTVVSILRTKTTNRN